MAQGRQTAPVVEENEDVSGCVQQGEQAKDLGMTEADCPYLLGDNRAAWLSGLES